MLVRNRIAILNICFFLIFETAFSQTGPPGTDIYVADLKTQEGALVIGTVKNITNRDGYDNQPFFLPDGKSLLYTSIRNNQADIYRYNLEDGTTKRITQTKESEYSPTFMPDGKYFSTVRVEADSSQRLWKFPLGGGEPSLLLEKIKPVGYHAWASRHLVALFVLGNPASMYLADIRDGSHEKVIDSPGRSLHKIPNRDAISFVHKISDDEWWIKLLELESRQVKPLIQTLAGSEDYAWTPDRTILMARDSKLFRWQSGRDETWREIADFKAVGLTGITRIAISPKGDKVALVSIRGLQ